jgi:hypothetical protein
MVARPGVAVYDARGGYADCAKVITVNAVLPDDSAVSIRVASCLADDPRKVGPPALTLEQATEVATDPRWGRTMDADLVKAGAARFPDLPGIS